MGGVLGTSKVEEEASATISLIVGRWSTGHSACVAGMAEEASTSRREGRPALGAKAVGLGGRVSGMVTAIGVGRTTAREIG